jgi:hypothetical protein
MGIADAYPFVLTAEVLRKLHFVHDVVEFWNASPGVASECVARWNAELDRVAADTAPPPLGATLPSARDAIAPAIRRQMNASTGAPQQGTGPR